MPAELVALSNVPMRLPALALSAYTICLARREKGSLSSEPEQSPRGLNR
jgi:hypothetical protein